MSIWQAPPELPILPEPGSRLFLYADGHLAPVGRVGALSLNIEARLDQSLHNHEEASAEAEDYPLRITPRACITILHAGHQ
jgi:hypothetical protein